LHEKQLCDKKLLVKCEEKAKQTIDAWKENRHVEIQKKQRGQTLGKRVSRSPAQGTRGGSQVY